MAEPYCDATFNYVGDASYVPVVQTVRDGRRTNPGAFDDCGFELLDLPSAVTDWRDEHEINRVHAREIAAAARERTGCNHVVIYPTIVRSPAAAAASADHAPIEVVHSDFTSDYRRMIWEPDRAYRAFLDPLLERLGLDRHDLERASRVMMLQFWRNTGPTDAAHPLAFCDARSIPETRLLRMVIPTYGGERLDFETFLANPPADGAQDSWFCFPQMTSDEAVALRTYDSERDAAGLAYWTPHSAFRDPHVPVDPSHRRESIEMRALCVWN